MYPYVPYAERSIISGHFPHIQVHNSSNLPSGKHTKSYGKSPFLMGKLTISMAMFNSHVCLPGGIYVYIHYMGKSPFGIGKSTVNKPLSIGNC